MRALVLITWNDLRQSFSDRSLLLLMFAAPLAVATIISVTFGSMADETSPVEHLPVALVNLDRGSPVADFGEQFEQALGVQEGPPPEEASQGNEASHENAPSRSAARPSFFPALTAYAAADEDEATRWLQAERVAAVIVLPADLSRRLTGPASRGPAEARVLTHPDREISGDIATTLTRGLLDGFAGGLSVTQAAVAAVATAEEVPPQRVLGREAFGELTGSFGTARGGQSTLSQRVRIEQRALHGGGIGFNPLVAFGATQAIFFALFTANGNATSILEERRDGTLVRLLTSPAPRAAVVGGKLTSTAAIVLLQLILLFVAFTFIGSLLEGRFVFIWGRQIGLIVGVLFVTSAAAAALGGIVAAAARSPEQSSVIGTVINMFMAITGGAFGFRFDNPVRYASAVYWGADAFEELAAGGSDIGANVAVLGAFALVFGLASHIIFVRRFTK